MNDPRKQAFVVPPRVGRIKTLVAKGMRAFVREGPRGFVGRVSDWNRLRQETRRLDSPDADLDSVPLHASVRARRAPRVPAPDVSIVVVAFNALPELRQCLTSVTRVGARLSYELVVIDNGSDRSLFRWLERFADEHTQVGFVRLASNHGFATGTNIGARMARGNTLVLLNSDTVVTDGWLDRLTEELERNPRLGAVSPVTNYVGEGPQLDPGAHSIGVADVATYAATIRGRRTLEVVPERLVFFCVALRREVYDLLNGLDDSFGAGNFEDEDLSARLELMGYELAVARDVFVFHHGSATFRANRIDHDALMARNAVHRLAKLSVLSAASPVRHARREGVGYPPSVSVVVRTKDRPDLLRIALNSLANQTYSDFEVVLVNDGGCDVTEVIDDFESHLRVIRVDHPTSVGLSDALNAGVDAGSGRYVTYLDDDDIVYPFHLASLMRAAEKLPGAEGFVYTHFNRAFVSRRETSGPLVVARLFSAPWTFDRDTLLVQNRPALHTWLHTRSLVKRFGDFDPNLTLLHDWDLLLRMSAEVPVVSNTRETCEYRVFLDLSNSTAKRDVAYRELREIYDRHPATSAQVERARQEELAALEAQAQLVDETLRQRDDGVITAEEALATVIRSQFGVTLPGRISATGRVRVG